MSVSTVTNHENLGSLSKSNPAASVLRPGTTKKKQADSIASASDCTQNSFNLNVNPPPTVSKTADQAGIKKEETHESKTSTALISADPSKQKKKRFEDLPCTSTDQAIIRTIITTISEGGIDLAWKSGNLYRIGKEIKPLHPFKFLSTIFCDKSKELNLKECMRKIFHDFIVFKKRGVLKGIEEGMVREIDNLEPYLDDFAKCTGVAPNPIRVLIGKRDWEKLVLYLLGEVSEHAILSSQG